MDKKKIIGTIIGVTMFAALIAGATYAFLSFAANITGGTYNGGTMNFMVDYTKGEDIKDVPQLTAATPDAAKSLVVQVAKNENSSDGNVTIKLNTLVNNALIRDEVVNYAICRGECIGDFSSGKTGTINIGATIAEDGTVEEAGTIELLTEQLEETAVSYYVYFWLDATKISTEHIGESYSGNISATAVQTE